MSKLNIDQKNIKSLFSEKRADFLIPDYQRPYAWAEDECQTLWDDIFAFAFPDDNSDNFKEEDEYFLGPIVTFKNDDGKLEVIDGQQRLTTLMLLLRAFYNHCLSMKDPQSLKIKEMLEQCIWKTDEFGTPKMDCLKIDSEVATDDDKDEFLTILRTGEVLDMQKSVYAKNFKFFDKQIDSFIEHYPAYFAKMPARIMNNCILLPIEAESQDTALRIFSTLNDRGKPLSDTDIFKAQLYKFYSVRNQKDAFIERWKELEKICSEIFTNQSGSPMDELFAKYMYYERAKSDIRTSTTEALRKFYEKDNYALLQNDEVLGDLENLASFWNDINLQNRERFSVQVLKDLFILKYAPNGMWSYILSVYFLKNHDRNGNLDDGRLHEFLNKIIAFVWYYAIINPGVNALRTPIYAAMADIIKGAPISFDDYRSDKERVNSVFHNYIFTNNRAITRSMMTWYMFYSSSDQETPDFSTPFDIEHIYAKNRMRVSPLSNPNLVESLGNKSLLERKINIRGSDYRFEDKKKLYLGTENKRGTMVENLRSLCLKDDFTEEDIMARNEQIIGAFIDFIDKEGLLK